MKNFKIFVLAAIAVSILPSCSDDDTTLVPVNEEEVITTVTATFAPTDGGNTVILRSRDLDGSGPDAPVVTVTGNFIAGKTYNGNVTLLNELQNPAGNITEEVEEEGAEHQLFFLQTNGNIGTFAYADQDVNGNSLGLRVTYNSATTAAAGTLTIVLVHEPNKNAAGVTIGNNSNAGGSTDAEVSFPVTIIPQ